MTLDPVALNQQGMMALRRGDTAGAISAFTAAVSADPDAAILHFNLANAHAAAGNADAQLDALNAALDRDPYMPQALLARGQLAELQGYSAAALADFKRLLAVVPEGQTPGGPGFQAGLAHARAAVAAETASLAARLEAVVASAEAAAPAAEAERFRHAVDVQLGRRRTYVHQPLVLNYPYLPAIQFFDRAHFPWLAQLEAATAIIRTELQALLAEGGGGFAPYVRYPPGAPVNQWGELNHSDAWAAAFLTEHGRGNATLRAHCPQTAAVLDSLPLFDLPGRGPVAFFSLLKPHTRIPPHTGATNIRSIIHLPLIVPPGCTFRVGNETRPWREGEAFAFDDTIEHEAVNPTDALRAVLIVDAWNPFIGTAERDLIRRWVHELDAHGQELGRFSAA
ncbi:aspartyl/asparaginyl beta-hydroxylase domain-containing protein [Novosphingobium piscinae]|uniref:Aspartyl/asparaginyl beta-hydroxylase domain-containing protein n=1 Tax=Novosphingobium piscinae TaxID=1507448 RepID=A0A7X1G107_9SPHN|nr:aspartyl/asparaginyl beta-hydroxylase domain-containing protein [Novosphingobium piscinae]MBC2669992.1 aspartyl/asparaginyl beta-hydroxylase domain-containing protein [Novosphingobium piscinae]